MNEKEPWSKRKGIDYQLAKRTYPLVTSITIDFMDDAPEDTHLLCSKV